MTSDDQPAGRAADGYRWIVLTNTTVGILMVTINSSIVLISLPAIGRRGVPGDRPAGQNTRVCPGDGSAGRPAERARGRS
jgi:hypothetical protein